MAEPKRVSAKDGFLWSFDFNQLQQTIQTEAQSNRFETLDLFLRIIAAEADADRPSTLVRSHSSFCVKLLPDIESGLFSGKFASNLERETLQKVMTLFARAGIFQKLPQDTKLSQAILCGTQQAKVPVILMALTRSDFYSQLLEKRFHEISALPPKPGTNVELQEDLSAEALVIVKNYYEKAELPTGPLKPGPLLELCRREKAKSMDAIGVVDFVRNALARGREGQFIWSGAEKKPENKSVRPVRKDEIDNKEMLKSLFQIHTCHDATDCIALVTLLEEGWDSKETREHLLAPLFGILADFKTEEAVRSVDALLPEMQKAVERLQAKTNKSKEKAEQVKRERRNSVTTFFEKRFSAAKKSESSPEQIGCQLFEFLRENSRSFKKKFENQLKIECLNQIFKANGIRTYHFIVKTRWGERDSRFGIDIEGLPLLHNSEKRRKLSESFNSLILTKENVAQLDELLKARGPFPEIQYIYSDQAVDPNTFARLKEICPNVKADAIVTRLESEESKNLHSKSLASKQSDGRTDQSQNDLLEDQTFTLANLSVLAKEWDRLKGEEKRFKEEMNQRSKLAREAQNDLNEIQRGILSLFLQESFNLQKRGDRSVEEVATAFFKLIGEVKHFSERVLWTHREDCIYYHLFPAYDIRHFERPKENQREDDDLIVGLEAYPFMQKETELGDKLRSIFNGIAITKERGLQIVNSMRLTRRINPAVRMGAPHNNIKSLYSEIALEPALIADLKLLFPALTDKTIIICENKNLEETSFSLEQREEGGWEDPAESVLRKLESKLVPATPPESPRKQEADSDDD